MALSISNISKNLTIDVIGKVFRAKTNSEDCVNSVEVFPAAPAGEGLMSSVYRIHLRGEKTTASLIVKALVKDPLLRQSLNCELMFLREIQFFSQVLPALIEVQKSLNAKENIQFNLPTCYSFQYDGSDTYIIMEDMVESHCTSISHNPTERDRDLALMALAHLHAVSIAMKVKRPELFKKLANELPEIYYTEARRPFYGQFLNNATDICRKTLAEFEDVNSVYFTRFSEFVDNGVFSHLMEAVGPSVHSVFCHGDSWCANFMSSSNRGVVLDFQLLRCASPVTDVSLFILMCSNLTRTKQDFLNSLKLYYDCVGFYLQDMGIMVENVFSWDDFMDELKKFGKYGIGVALTCIPLAFSDKLDYFDNFEVKYVGKEKIPLEELWHIKPFKNEEQKMRLVNAVRIAVDVGLI